MLRLRETNKNFSTSLNELNGAVQAAAAAAKTNDLMSMCLNEGDEMYRNEKQ